MATIEEGLASAIALHRSLRFDEAKALYRQILEIDRGHLNALFLLGQAERQTGNAEGAVALFRDALRLDPSPVEIRGALASALLAAGRHAEGEDQYRRTLCLEPARFKAIQELAAHLCMNGGSGRLGDAVTLQGRLVALDPGRAESHQDLGVALRYAERLEEAIASQWRAIALKPDFAVAWMAQANFINESGDRDLGLACIRRATALSPAIPEIYYNHGNIQNTRGEAEVAARMYARAYRLGMPGALVRVAGVLIDLDRLDEAEALLKTAHGIRGGDPGTAINMLPRIFIRQGRVAEGRSYFTALAGIPAADGVSYAGECMTALATLDLHENRPLEAARLLARVVGDSSHLFTIKSIASFRVTLESQGLRLTRPAGPDPQLPRISSSTLATHGRFAHNALEYILIRLYAEKYGYVLETPEWVGGYFFQIDDPLPSRPLRPLYFPRRIVNALVTGTATYPPIPDCDILSPLFLIEHKEEYRARVQSWMQPRAVWRPFLDPALDRLRERGDTIVAIHIRRGDFVKFKYPLTQTAWYVEWLRSLWGELKNPVLYLASDDLDGVRRDFAEFSPLTRADVIDPWPGLEYLQDFHVLMHADVVGISAASGYSLLAARLNTAARLCVEPDMDAQRIRPFQPWTP